MKIDFDNQIINKIEIIDINGNSIFNEVITIEENSKIINTSKLPIGAYFLRITSNQETETHKFIKE
ncbi:MAG: T9SS type A sorting domain-containing protein [Ignavibacteria bacterium]|nr:T9SS type A sorting domain-containing protein [Ignavibacteria bacterium]